MPTLGPIVAGIGHECPGLLHSTLWGPCCPDVPIVETPTVVSSLVRIPRAQRISTNMKGYELSRLIGTAIIQQVHSRSIQSHFYDFYFSLLKVTLFHQNVKRPLFFQFFCYKVTEVLQKRQIGSFLENNNCQRHFLYIILFYRKSCFTVLFHHSFQKNGISTFHP